MENRYGYRQKNSSEKYDCCGAEVTNIADHIWENGHCTVCGYDCIHTGGKTTCTQKAVCNICHSEYGEINADNHSGVENGYRQQQHMKRDMIAAVK